ncbi:3'-5' exoribonuclease domain-containing protein, partial [Enterococcus faecium]
MTQPGYVMSEVVPGILSAVPSRSVVLTEDDIKPKHGIGQKTFVMIDIESLGLRVGSPILSVGICSVVPGIGIIDSMKWNLNLQEQLNRGGKIEADAFFWWLNQS